MAIFNSLIDANNAYTALATTLDEADGEVTVPANANMGGVAQTALVAFMVAGAAESADVGADPAEALYELVINGDGSSFTGGVTLGDPSEDAGLNNILDAAGLGDLLSSFGGGEEA